MGIGGADFPFSRKKESTGKKGDGPVKGGFSTSFGRKKRSFSGTRPGEQARIESAGDFLKK